MSVHATHCALISTMKRIRQMIFFKFPHCSPTLIVYKIEKRVKLFALLVISSWHSNDDNGEELTH